MAIGDFVMFPPLVGVGDMPHGYGIVIAENNGAAPPTADVMWQDTGKVQTAIEQPQLMKVFGTVPVYMLLRDMQWLQLDTYPSQAEADGEPRSPAAGGLLIGQFMLGAYDAAEGDPELAYGRLAINNGENTVLFTEGPYPSFAEASASLEPPDGSTVTTILARRNS